MLWDTTTTTPTRQTMNSKKINISTTKTSVFNNNEPQEGTERAMHQTLRKQPVIINNLLFYNQQPNSKDLKNDVHKAIHPNHSEDACRHKILTGPSIQRKAL